MAVRLGSITTIWCPGAAHAPPACVAGSRDDTEGVLVDHDEIGELEILVTYRHHVFAKGTLVPEAMMPCTTASWCRCWRFT